MLYILTRLETLSLITEGELPIDDTLDAILLTQDCVYAANPKHKDHHILLSFKNSYLLEEDAIARGVSSLLSSSIQVINYEGMVGLTENYSPIVSW